MDVDLASAREVEHSVVDTLLQPSNVALPKDHHSPLVGRLLSFLCNESPLLHPVVGLCTLVGRQLLHNARELEHLRNRIVALRTRHLLTCLLHNRGHSSALGLHKCRLKVGMASDGSSDAFKA